MNKTKLFLTIIIPYALGYFTCTIFRSVNAVLSPTLTQQLHINANQLGLLTSTYVLAFGLSQIPLGVLLDKFGPRLVQSVLYVIGAASILVFGFGSSVTTLTISRAVLGIGMSSGLMAALKAITEAYPKEQHPLYNGIVMAFGGLGALIVTSPSEWFIANFGWRELCFVFAGLTFVVAVITFMFTPRHQKSQEHNESMLEQFKGLGYVFKQKFFWHVVPIFATGAGGFIALQGLWVAPWFNHVDGMSNQHMATYLLAIAIAMIFGVLSGGFISRMSRSLNIPLTVSLLVLIVLGILTQLAIIFRVFPVNYAIWVLYAFFGTAAMLGYAVVSQKFPSHLAGRVVTAANLVVFLTAFIIQFALGHIIEIWHMLPSGGYPVVAYQVAFGAVVALQILATLWFLISKPKACDHV